ncbi:Uncharacterized protein SAPIO_CDS5949 [Scedosporium apiospermum]|uniref:NACHT domain-containing protein n=1 Tax=Pseudallescheria apiosperma TaxID=563466 RepID=A0A084G5T0_PSEDA|nr:Uncharacterized protein SAPIO_CDS5949 [Scedosporium apiospermum]KEZ42692.1 Uncharacterized protein SAPIO_CDS5949 [Scedosporium apiospermum]
MEGLGVAASVIAVIDLSAKVASALIRYSKDVRSARDDIERLKRGADGLDKASRRVQRLLDGPNRATLEGAQEMRDLLNDSRLQLDQLVKELDPGKGRKAMSRFGFRSLEWPLKSKDVEKIAQDLGNRRQAIFSYLQAALILDADQKRALDKLPVADGATFDSHAEGEGATCYPSTRVHLLSQIDEWADSRTAEAIFWLNGMAGTGKSTISRTVARAMFKKGQLGASFLFKRGHGDRGKATRFFTTIAAQLVLKEPAMAAHVRNAIDSGVLGKTMGEQFEKLILAPLSEIPHDARRSQRLVIVVDALDECDDENDQVSRMIGHLFRVKTLQSVQLKIFVTSRPELHIRFGFKTVNDAYDGIILHEIPRPVIEKDIRAFLTIELARIRDRYNVMALSGFQLPSDWPGPSKIETLVTMAVPLFIFAATVCRFVQGNESPEIQLAKFLRYRSMSQLDATYLPVLNQLVPRVDDSERSDVIEGFRELIGPIVLLRTPLSPSSLEGLIQVRRDVIYDRLQLLHSVLSISPDIDTPITTFHLSFREFLVAPNKRATNPFWVDEKETHKRLAANCLRLLDKHLRADVCALKWPGTARSAVDPQTINKALLAEVQYASLYWVYHTEQANDRLQDGGQAHNFLRVHFLHWLEALSLIGQASEAITLIQALEALLKPEASTSISRFLADATRFVQANIVAIKAAPLQAYSSALVFAPEMSIVKETFRDRVPAWLALPPKADTEWSVCLQTLEGQWGDVNSVAFSPDGTQVASGSDDNTVRIWQAKTGECTQIFKGHGGNVTSVAFSPDGTHIVSGSSDKTVRIWQVKTGEYECVQTLKGHGRDVTSVAFSPDGMYIISGSWDETVQIWQVKTGKCIQALKGCSRDINSVAFSPDGMHVVSGSLDNTVWVWEVKTGKCVQTLEGHSGFVTSVAFSRDGMHIVSGSWDNTVRIWQVKIGECIQTLKGHRWSVSSVAFSPDSMHIVSGSWDKTVRIWQVKTGECVQTLKGHRWSVSSVAFSPDSMHIVSGSWDKTVRIWQVKTGECVQTLKGHGAVSSVAFSPNGMRIVSGSWDKTVRIWQVKMGECIQALKGHGEAVNSVAFSPDGMHIVSGSSDNTVRIWQVKTGECVQTLQCHEAVSSVAFSPDGTHIGSALKDNTVRIWQVKTSECVQAVDIGVASQRLAFEPDGLHVLTDVGAIIVDPSIVVNTASEPRQKSASTISRPDDSSTGSGYEDGFGTGPGEGYSNDQDTGHGGGHAERRFEYGFSTDSCWVTWHGKNLLWLPAEFRPVCSAVAASAVAIGCSSGRVVVMSFSSDRLPI